MPTTTTEQFVWLVMSPDHQVIDVCLDQESADHFAHVQSGIAERCPISRTERMKAWARALSGREVSGSTGQESSSLLRPSDVTNGATDE